MWDKVKPGATLLRLQYRRALIWKLCPPPQHTSATFKTIVSQHFNTNKHRPLLM